MFWTNYLSYCNEIKESANAVAAKCGIQSSGTVTGWSKNSKPRPATLMRIADYFTSKLGRTITVADLTGEKASPASVDDDIPISSLSPDAQEVLQIYTTLQGARKADALDHLRYTLEMFLKENEGK